MKSWYSLYRLLGVSAVAIAASVGLGSPTWAIDEGTTIVTTGKTTITVVVDVDECPGTTPCAETGSNGGPAADGNDSMVGV